VFEKRLPKPIDAATAARALRKRPGLAWLDGGPTHPAEGRLSFVGSDPVEVRRASFGDSDAPLDLLRGLSPHASAVEPRWRSAPTWMGFVAYDAALVGRTHVVARVARAPAAPVVWLGRYDAVLAWDESASEAWLLGDDEAACDRLALRLEEGRALSDPTAQIDAVVEPDPARHRRAITEALTHIAEGDIYQVNLARRFSAPFEGDPLALFLAMREASPVPLGFYADTGDHAVLARTMERFLSWDGPDGELSTRPIKGTIAREGDDASEASRLQSDVKERAEHSMIVDLMRNDLGRVAAVGTVVVEEPLVVEPYAGLAHLVSTVRCRTAEGVDLADIFAATFPPGSVTGTPKIRAMQIIEALEDEPREVYTGAVGMIDRDGGARFAVAIRTAQVRRGEVVYHAGGGLVEASDPEREVAETELKARVFFDAVRSLRRRRAAS
jgi:para-aminobenzoate synthetase component 1